VPVEDQLVLPPDEVAERHVGARVARTRDEHLLAVFGLADVERRGRQVDDQLRAGEREVGRRRAGLPHVLADRRADQDVAVLQQEEVVPRREVAVLVEDAVVGQETLAVDRLDLARRAYRARVVEVAVEVRSADQRRDSARGACDLVERALGGADEPGAQEEVFGRISGDCELREEDEIRMGLLRLLQPAEDALAVAVEVADDGVDLGERESHRCSLGFRLSVENVASEAW
jgi:hypothetical protein